MSSVELSVVIPVYSKTASDRRLTELLHSIRLQRDAPDFEVFVVANPPSTAIQAIVEQFDRRFHYLESAATGVNRARNMGWTASSGSVVLFLDDDCLLHRDRFLVDLLEQHRRFPVVAILGGPYELAESSKKSRLSLAYHTIQEDWVFGKRQIAPRFPFLLGGNFSIKRHVFRAGFRFEEKLSFGGTETELLHRLAQAGYSARMERSLSVSHRSRVSFSGFLRKAFLQGQGAAFSKSLYGEMRELARDSTVGERELSLWHHLYRRFFALGKRENYGKSGQIYFKIAAADLRCHWKIKGAPRMISEPLLKN